MTTVTTAHDTEALTITVTAELDASVERSWQLWSDPRQLERWWGPPGYPATFVEHELAPGGRVHYFMTGPEGDQYHGYWALQSVDEPTSLVFTEGFATADGAPDDSMPRSTTTVTFRPREGGGTTMVVEGTHESLEDLEKLLEMGQLEGMAAAMSQIDDILADDASRARHG